MVTNCQVAETEAKLSTTMVYVDPRIGLEVDWMLRIPARKKRFTHSLQG